MTKQYFPCGRNNHRLSDTSTPSEMIAKRLGVGSWIFVLRIIAFVVMDVMVVITSVDVAIDVTITYFFNNPTGLFFIGSVRTVIASRPLYAKLFKQGLGTDNLNRTVHKNMWMFLTNISVRIEVGISRLPLWRLPSRSYGPEQMQRGLMSMFRGQIEWIHEWNREHHFQAVFNDDLNSIYSSTIHKSNDADLFIVACMCFPGAFPFHLDCA